MASGSSKSPQSARTTQSAQERRAAQRENLRKQREAELRRQRTVRTAVISIVVILALVLAAGIGYLIWRQTRPAEPAVPPSGVAQDQGYLSFGAPEGSGKPVLEVHLDFMCPFCGQFEKINGADISELIEQKAVTVHMVPRRFLDTYSKTGDYSTRSANAFVCAYDEDPKKALTLQSVLFENQPAEGSAGLSDEELTGFAQQAGLSEKTLSCLDKLTFRPWVRQNADPYAAERAEGTPYVALNDEVQSDKVWQRPGALKAAILKAGGSTASDAGGSSDAGGASDAGQG